MTSSRKRLFAAGLPPAGLRAAAWAAAAGVALAAAWAGPAGAAAARRPEPGTEIEVTGVVTGPDGVPLVDVQVVLEATRVEFSVTRMSKTAKETTHLTARTDDRGTYRLVWPWDRYYNRFALLVGVPLRKAGEDRFHELERIEVTRRIESGGPVVTSVVVREADFIANLRRFLASVDSDDERRTYEEMGKPDKVEEQVWSDGSGRTDAAWWYFAAGRVFRFRDGALAGTETFDAVREF